MGKAIRPNSWGPPGTGVGEGRRGGQAQLQQGKEASGQPSAVRPDVASAAGGSTTRTVVTAIIIVITAVNTDTTCQEVL